LIGWRLECPLNPPILEDFKPLGGEISP
jgi:hypothetical protein